MVGYRTDEVRLPEFVPLDPATRIFFDNIEPNKDRPVLRVSLGCHFVGAANCCPDTTDPPSTLAGLTFRLARSVNTDIDPTFMDEFRQFVGHYLRTYLRPLRSDSDVSVGTWLRNSKYTLVRQKQLHDTYLENFASFPDIFLHSTRSRSCRSFVKDESYNSFKYPRIINSRNDIFKVFFGPIISLIEKEVFQMEDYVKYISVDERPHHLLENISQDGAKYFGTDFTSFEASFTPELMLASELQLYEYMTSLLPDQTWIRVVRKVLTSSNTCVFRKFVALLLARRMSGEMCTSLGNGWTNNMAVKFCCMKAGSKKLKGRIEGDDGIFSCFGNLPTPDLFKKLGLNIKIVIYEGPTLGSFCGMIMHPSELINIADPIDVLLNMGWTTREYLHSKDRKLTRLLKAKGYSYLYQYKGCPIIDALARYVLRVTKEVEYLIPKSTDSWQLWKIESLFLKYKGKLPDVKCGLDTRLLMEKQFRVTVADQITSEAYLDSLTEVQPLDMPWLMKYVNDDQRTMFERYTFERIQLPCDYLGTNHRSRKPIQALTVYETQTKTTT